MKPAPLPRGRCLTDVWGGLQVQQRQRWLVVVAREARAVAIEVKAARDAARPPGLDAAATAEASAEVAFLRAEGSVRAAQLASNLAGYRVGRPARRCCRVEIGDI